MPWNPVQYEKFKKERAAPFEDLLAMIDVRDGTRMIRTGQTITVDGTSGVVVIED